jgi:hypothetical protein
LAVEVEGDLREALRHRVELFCSSITHKGATPHVRPQLCRQLALLLHELARTAQLQPVQARQLPVVTRGRELISYDNRRWDCSP